VPPPKSHESIVKQRSAAERREGEARYRALRRGERERAKVADVLARTLRTAGVDVERALPEPPSRRDLKG
jgi:hypothetical protein